MAKYEISTTTLLLLGLLAFMLFRVRRIRAEEVPPPEEYEVLPPVKPVIYKEYPLPPPGAYIAELVPFKEIVREVTPAREVEAEFPTTAEQIEATIRRFALRRRY